ncbi:MAG: hypothetical protein AAF483_18020 [Planctomycetota bacterium]
MSSADSEIPESPLAAATSLMGTEDTDFEHRMLDIPERGWEGWWVALSEKVNPIVIKELRQSLKSRQFTMSFGLTLIAAVGWTLLAISLTVPRIYYAPGGPTLLAGYFIILILPLMVILPFSAFRSLSAETEESTFELLSISALSAQQIVYGKMASAMLQLVLYLSAIAPCIVLTYLLRGLSIFTILFLLGLTIVFSVCETALALLFAAIGHTRLVQGIVSVIVLAGLLVGAFGWTGVLMNAPITEFVNPSQEMYIGLFAGGTVIALAISLVLRAAAAAIDFPSENHSTPLRLRIFGLTTLSTFWMIFLIFASEDFSYGNWTVCIAFILLMFCGALITGEYGVISPRSQRTLPKTFAGRVLLTWLYPGAGLGYVFVVVLFAGMALTFSGIELGFSRDNRNGDFSVSITSAFLLCYMIIYLGIGRLLFLLIPKSTPTRMLGSLTFTIVMLVFGHLLPLLIMSIAQNFRDIDYKWHQFSNVIWTVVQAQDELAGSNVIQIDPFSQDIGVSLVIVTLCAALIFGLNLLLSTRDVLLVRISAPPRVREEVGAEETPEPSPEDPFAPES